jgi:hypothetical protein
MRADRAEGDRPPVSGAREQYRAAVRLHPPELPVDDLLAARDALEVIHRPIHGKRDLRSKMSRGCPASRRPGRCLLKLKD